MKRRSFITLLGGAAAAWPLAAWPLVARAQQQRPVIGFLGTSTRDEAVQYLTSIRQGLADTGFMEGENLTIAYRWADNQYNRLPTLAGDLVRLRVALIITLPAAATLAVQAATASIPIVFTVGGDPVDQLRLVASYNRPGGNMTGVTTYTNELWGKRMEQMREILPAMSSVAVLVNPQGTGFRRASSSALDAARALGLEIWFLHASTEAEVDAAFASLVQRRPSALMIQGDAFIGSRHGQIITLAARHSIPVGYVIPLHSVAGGLISYGIGRADHARLYRQMGIYAGRILKGEKPGDLPIVQPTRFELVVNLKTARALGLTIPETFLVRADEVIE